MDKFKLKIRPKVCLTKVKLRPKQKFKIINKRENVKPNKVMLE